MSKKGVTFFWPNGAYVVVDDEDLHTLLTQFGKPVSAEAWVKDETHEKIERKTISMD